jgi:hypothetical protein
MATKTKLKAFQNILFTDDMLEIVIEWIRNNYSPNEVFDEDELVEWAQAQDLLELMDEDTLAGWATENGYILEEDCPECN